MVYDFTLRSYSCAICGSRRRKAVRVKMGIVLSTPFTIVRCLDCGHRFVDPRIANEELGYLYDEQYYRGLGFDRSVNYAADVSDRALQEIDGVIGTVSSALDRTLEGARWLDFGCGPGHLLKALQALDVSAIGFDDSEAAISLCREKNLNVVDAAMLSQLVGSFDVVSAIEVIEHVPDPRDFLRFVTSFLRPGGIAYVQTGNWNTVKWIPGTPYLMPEGHIHYFTPKEMRRLFAECGLTEALVFNRSWFMYRDMPMIRKIASIQLYLNGSLLTGRLAPGLAPFPVAIRY